VFNTQVPTKTKSLHRGPGGAGELAAGEGGRQSWPTSGPVRWVSSPRGYWWWIWGRGRLRRGGTTETDGGDRGEDCSGVLFAREYAREAREASQCPRGGARGGISPGAGGRRSPGRRLAMAGGGARLGVRRQRARLASFGL
jgi:hypothetical protein